MSARVTQIGRGFAGRARGAVDLDDLVEAAEAQAGGIGVAQHGLLEERAGGGGRRACGCRRARRPPRGTCRGTRSCARRQGDDALKTLELERPQGAGLERLVRAVEVRCLRRAAPPARAPSCGADLAPPGRRRPGSSRATRGTLRAMACSHVSTAKGRCADSAPTSTTPATLTSPISSATALPSTTVTRRLPASMRATASNG